MLERLRLPPPPKPVNEDKVLKHFLKDTAAEDYLEIDTNHTLFPALKDVRGRAGAGEGEGDKLNPKGTRGTQVVIFKMSNLY